MSFLRLKTQKLPSGTNSEIPSAFIIQGNRKIINISSGNFEKLV